MNTWKFQPQNNVLLYHAYLYTKRCVQVPVTLSCTIILEITLAPLQRTLINDVRVNIHVSLHDCCLSQLIWYTEYIKCKNVRAVLHIRMLINFPVWHISTWQCV